MEQTTNKSKRRGRPPGSGKRNGLGRRIRRAGGLRLSDAAARLLTGLGAKGAYAVAHPCASEELVLRTERAGVSLGAGRFPVACAQELVRSDLAAWSRAPGRERLEIAAAGRAHLRRAAVGEGETAYLAQHLALARGMVDAGDGEAEVLIDQGESPLDWLRRRRDVDGRPFLDPAACEAGERLRRDLTLAGLLPSVTVRWELAVDRGGRAPASATEVMIAARQRVARALKHVGADFAGLLVDLCGFLKRLEVVERERGWPPRSGKVVVRLALSRLAEHYGLAGEARGPAGSAGIRVWRDPVPVP